MDCLPFDPRLPEFRANPYPTYRYLQTHYPIYYRPDHNDWLLTRYADVADVLKSSKFGRTEHHQSSVPQISSQRPLHRFFKLRQESQNLMGLWLVLRNPPDHSRIRSLLHHPYRPVRVQALRSHLQTTVHTLIDRVQAQGQMDLIADLAYPLTLSLNCKILGIPPQAWHPKFKQWSEDLSVIADMDVTPMARERGLLAIAGLADYFQSWFDQCRNITQGQDNLIATLMQAVADHQLSETELLSTCIFMFTVGHSSTANLLGISMLTLLQHPHQLQLLQSEPSLMGTAINEVLRYDSPVQGVSRKALVDVELDDHMIPRGQVVNCIIAAANRDPAKFSEPDVFNIKRSPNPFLSFGQGIHLCIGKHMAKLVAEITVGTLVQRLPKLSFVSTAPESFDWEESFLGRGLKSLPLSF
ncbi:cytochrome P450 [Leptolyngbyaceae cyanobacterium CCMR0082]|uniref:Cytochrome P450 n=1 Tax=Adonisia turfae CCMR0082 TaxID=2304604 RepID=A0A6M0S4Z5_9CYAN|nr:cytochrome P450 [Adonisia turfae]NEZ63594.1 cytochrome P450 [Adonisia turfae CCMR0082]